MSWAVAAASALALLSCGGDGDGSATGSGHPSPSGTATRSYEHVHGLGVSPADGSLYIATHNGLFRAPAGSARAERVGDSDRDVMGFSIVSADRFIGSGHPGPLENDPPNLGLIESKDGGETWDKVSLLGEADFHVLESSGGRVYGFDATGGRFLVSEDGGRDWDERDVPAPMIDLALDPRSGTRMLAATQGGLQASSDGGRRWRALDPNTAGLLAWPAADRLYLVDGRGQVQRSADDGRTWTALGQIGGMPAAFEAYRDELYAALANGTVKRSTDGGRTWKVRAAP